MEEIVLLDFETFEEIPHGLLLVNEKTNIMYIKIKNEVFIAREFLDSVLGDNTKISYVVNYYDVRDNKNILTLNIIKNIDDDINILGENSNIQIIPLNDILNVKNNSETYLTLSDIEQIIKFKEESSKEKRKSYF